MVLNALLSDCPLRQRNEQTETKKKTEKASKK